MDARFSSKSSYPKKRLYKGMKEEEYRIEEPEPPDRPALYPQVEFNRNPDSLFFNDEKRRIDFVLVYEDESKKEFEKRHAFQKHKRRREYFESSLMKMGVELEAARSVVNDKLIFVKVHLPWDVLCTYAEILHIKMPIETNDLPSEQSPLRWFIRCFYPSEDIIHKEQEYFTAPFQKDRLDHFLVQNKDHFFTPSMRSRMANYILSRAVYEPKGKTKFGISKLLDGGVYKAAYPLHDVKKKKYKSESSNERYLLYTEWANPLSFYKMQPLDLIRKYYGEKIGIYFAWLGFYTFMLTLAAAVGLACFIYGYYTRETSTWSKEVCDPQIGGEIFMCPRCDKQCTYWRLNTTCETSQEKEKVPFRGCGKCLRLSCGIGTVLFWIALIIVSVVAVIVYRLAVFFAFSVSLHRDIKHIKELEPLTGYVTPQMATTVTASLISFVIIMILNVVYERVAIWITDFELPRTRTDYENSLTLKMFLFQFVNYYSSCIYVAFFKGKVVGYPGQPVYWLGKYRNEECDPGGCLIELTTQLAIIMGGKAIWNNIQEVLLPWVKNLMFRRCSQQTSEQVLPRWEQDYQLQPVGKLGLFYEYLEMVIQFGFVTLFVASFPLAPLLALVNNLFEIRVDAWKMTTQCRRMVPEKAQDIGAWQAILQGVAILAVVTNAAIIAFTSDMIPRLVYYWSTSMALSTNHTMEGYINNTLSVFKISDFTNFSMPEDEPPWFKNSTTCRSVSCSCTHTSEFQPLPDQIMTVKPLFRDVV
uniref:Anoctamin n=1 Tax=Denticeps clupeoides TaxID=299321 RepID=A0AAY4D0S3_9TELE